jgi:5-(carboxyamino)imidazole ribonucleotide synthase
MAERPSGPLAPGGVIGILGGGQLGRMTALAAAALGYRCHVYCPRAGEPASQVTDRTTVAPYDDAEALAAFAEAVDVVTYEFENVPGETAGALAERVPARPRPEVLAICQDRLAEKDFLARIGVPTTRYAEARDPDGLARALRNVAPPAVLKSARFGYDGKGQVPLKADSDPEAAWREMAGSVAHPVGIVEAWVDFDLEISVVVARALDGSIATYVPVENQHVHHILDNTTAPARIAPATADRAEAIARHVAEEIGLVGVIGVEMFVAADGEVLVNELAPRPHNSGHWTIDACVTSQFENHVRAVAGLPLGSTERHHDAVMKNLLGDEVERWREIAREPGAKLHIYGKAEVRPGRKMGHVTRLSPRR